MIVTVCPFSQIFSVMQFIDHIGPKSKSQNAWCYKNSFLEQHKTQTGKKSIMITLTQKATGNLELETSNWLVRWTQVCFILYVCTCTHFFPIPAAHILKNRLDIRRGPQNSFAPFPTHPSTGQCYKWNHDWMMKSVAVDEVSGGQMVLICNGGCCGCKTL